MNIRMKEVSYEILSKHETLNSCFYALFNFPWKENPSAFAVQESTLAEQTRAAFYSADQQIKTDLRSKGIIIDIMDENGLPESESVLTEHHAESLQFNNPEELTHLFEQAKYVADLHIVMPVFLALKMQRPLLIEGDPGCGKTEIAKVLSEGLGTHLIRLQCYEGLDASSTIYEWDYLKQLLSIRLEEGRKSSEEVQKTIFSERFLLKRPLLEAILYKGEKAPVLLIDEIDRADEEFEGFLLELLAEFQVTIPELGTFRAQKRPIIIITSNRTRELGDGLRRRCLYLYMSYPSKEKELKIVELKVPGIEENLAKQVVQAVSQIRASEDVIRKPGTSEALDWALALVTLGEKKLTAQIAKETLSCVLKNSEELSSFSTDERLATIIS